MSSSNNIFYSTSYNHGTLIPEGLRGPPQPMVTQNDPNLQQRQVIHHENQLQRNITRNNPYPEALNGQRPMTIASPTYDQHIIKPPKENVTHGRIPDTEIIRSEDRNFTLYPEPGKYVIKLKDVYKNVTSVTLYNASIPNTAHLVAEDNNLIYFRETECERLVAEIPVGDYDKIEDLMTAISSAMTNVSMKKNGAGNHSVYTANVDNLTTKIFISSNLNGGDHIFSLDFYGGSEPHDNRTRAIYPHNSMGKIIGYPRKNFKYANGSACLTAGSDIISGDSEATFKSDFRPGNIFYVEECDQIFVVDTVFCDDEMKVTVVSPCDATDVCLAKGTHYAPHKYDLSSDAYIILDILELENIRSNSTPVDRAFAMIPMIFPHNTKNFVVSSSGGVPPYIKYFNPPLARLDRLTVHFKNTRGNTVNFQGIENTMEFRIHTLNASGKYDPGASN